MAEYQQLLDQMTGALNSTVLRRSDNAYIPNDEGNRDWGAYQTWLAEGNVPDAPEPLPEPTAAGPSLEERIARLERLMAAAREA